MEYRDEIRSKMERNLTTAARRKAELYRGLTRMHTDFTEVFAFRWRNHVSTSARTSVQKPVFRAPSPKHQTRQEGIFRSRAFVMENRFWVELPTAAWAVPALSGSFDSSVASSFGVAQDDRLQRESQRIASVQQTGEPHQKQQRGVQPRCYRPALKRLTFSILTRP